MSVYWPVQFSVASLHEPISVLADSPFKLDHVFRDVQLTLLPPYPIKHLGVLTLDFFFVATDTVSTALQISHGHANKHFHFGICQRTNNGLRFLEPSLHVIECLMVMFSRFGNYQVVRMRAHAVSALHNLFVIIQWQQAHFTCGRQVL